MKKKISEIASGIGHALGIPRKPPLAERIASSEAQRHEQALKEFYDLAGRDADSLTDDEVSRLGDLGKKLGYTASDAARHRDLMLGLRDDVEQAALKNERAIEVRAAQKRLTAAKADAKAAENRLWQAKRDLAVATTGLSRSTVAESNIRTAKGNKSPWATGIELPA